MYKFKFIKELERPDIIKRYQIISRYKFYGEHRVCPEDFIFENTQNRVFLIHNSDIQDDPSYVLELVTNGEWINATISSEIINIAKSRVLSWKIDKALKQAIIDKKSYRSENLLIENRPFELLYKVKPETKTIEKIIYKQSDILGIYKLQKLVYNITFNTVTISPEKPYFAVITKQLYRRLRKESEKQKILAEKTINAQG